MKKKWIPLFSGYRRRREEARREAVKEQVIRDLEKTMRRQRQLVYGIKETAKPETAEEETKNEE